MFRDDRPQCLVKIDRAVGITLDIEVAVLDRRGRRILGRVTRICQRFQPNVARGAATSLSPWASLEHNSARSRSARNHDRRIAPNSTEPGARILLASRPSGAARPATRAAREAPRSIPRRRTNPSAARASGGEPDHEPVMSSRLPGLSPWSQDSARISSHRRAVPADSFVVTSPQHQCDAPVLHPDACASTSPWHSTEVRNLRHANRGMALTGGIGTLQRHVTSGIVGDL